MEGKTIGEADNDQLPDKVLRAIADRRLLFLVWITPEGAAKNMVNDRFI